MNRPKIEDFPDVRDYIISLEQFIKKKDEPLRNDALKFVNKWLGYKDDNKLIGLTNFRYVSMNKLPSDEKSKEFMIKYFNKYNEDFKLDFEYDDNLFTTDNVLYFLKEMLQKIGYKLIKHTKYKTPSYSIVFNKK